MSQAVGDKRKKLPRVKATEPKEAGDQPPMLYRISAQFKFNGFWCRNTTWCLTMDEVNEEVDTLRRGGHTRITVRRYDRSDELVKVANREIDKNYDPVPVHTLTRDEVLEVLRLAKLGTMTDSEIGERVGCQKSMVARIKHGKARTEVTGLDRSPKNYGRPSGTQKVGRTEDRWSYPD